MTHAMPSVSPARANNFNLLRLLLATLVILSHAPELVDGNTSRELLMRMVGTDTFGGLALNGFFLLSGYLIVQSWMRAPRAGVFLRSRVLRIYPGFVAATLVCAVLVGPLAAAPGPYFAALSLADLAQGAALLQPPAVPPVFAGSHYPRVNGAMWTIGYEFICYLTVLGAGLLGLLRRRRAWLAATAAVLGTLLLHRFGLFAGTAADGVLGHPLARLLSFFLTGGAFFLYRERVPFTRALALAAGAVLLVGLFSWRLSEFTVAVAGGYLLLSLAFAPNAAVAGFNRLPDVSYGVYLYGWPLQKLLLWYIPALSPWLLFALAWVAALACGTLSWYAIEQPFLRFKAARAPAAGARLVAEPEAGA